MKYLKSRHKLILEKYFKSILYHGSPSFFKDFKNTTTFFSETEEFAIDYAEQKSFDYALDAEPKIYKVLVQTELFDINDKDDYQKMKEMLPEEIEYAYNNFGFTTMEKKEEFLRNLAGYGIAQVYEPVKKAKIGDEIPNPEYRSEKFKVYKIDDDYVYTFPIREFNSYLEVAYDDYSDIRGRKKEIHDVFEDLRNFLDDYVRMTTGSKYVSSNQRKWSLYAFKYKSDYYDLKKPSDEEQETYERLLEEAKQKLQEKLIENNYIKKFIRKPTRYEMDDTWRFYENQTVQSIIKKLKYGGYVAKEKGVKTYAIFKPKDDTTILSYQIPYGREFDSIEDFEKFKEYDSKVYKMMKSHFKDDVKASLRVDRWMMYRNYKNNVSIEDTVKQQLEN